jgi:hypothetical protein
MCPIPCDTCILTKNEVKFIVIRRNVASTNTDALWLFFEMLSASVI